MKIQALFLSSLIADGALIDCVAQVQQCCPVHVTGTMRHVMHDGQLAGTIDLDTLSQKIHLYGLGPVEYLTGELLIVDGKAYRSIVQTDSTMIVEETFEVKAPFFVYANVDQWKSHKLPRRIRTLTQLEAHLDRITRHLQRPFAFKLTGHVESATMHIVNLPKGTEVHSPDDAHQGRKSYRIRDQEVIIVGFFSTQHKGIFTHHDTYLHMHLITADKKQMGHLDNVHFKNRKMRLYLPQSA